MSHEVECLTIIFAIILANLISFLIDDWPRWPSTFSKHQW